MAWSEDPTDFLADFGVTVTAGAVSGLGILDMPGEYIGPDGRIITTEYVLRAETSKFGNLSYNDSISIAGDVYVVREAPLRVDDGKFCLMLLSKATAETVPVPDRPVIEIRIDTATVGIIYVGQALHGAADASPVWTITRSTFNAAGVRQTKLTATAVTWTGRASHTYT